MNDRAVTTVMSLKFDSKNINNIELTFCFERDGIGRGIDLCTATLLCLDTLRQVFQRESTKPNWEDHFRMMLKQCLDALDAGTFELKTEKGNNTMPEFLKINGKVHTYVSQKEKLTKDGIKISITKNDLRSIFSQVQREVLASGGNPSEMMWVELLKHEIQS